MQDSRSFEQPLLERFVVVVCRVQQPVENGLAFHRLHEGKLGNADGLAAGDGHHFEPPAPDRVITEYLGWILAIVPNYNQLFAGVQLRNVRSDLNSCIAEQDENVIAGRFAAHEYERFAPWLNQR